MISVNALCCFPLLLEQQEEVLSAGVPCTLLHPDSQGGPGKAVEGATDSIHLAEQPCPGPQGPQPR